MMKEKKLAVLAKYGVSLPQYRVMDSVYTGPFGSYEAEQLAYYTERLLEGSNIQYRSQDYMQAIAECIAKGWLRTLDTPLPPEMTRQPQIPCVRSENGPARGIGFTPEGYQTHRKIRTENFGNDYVQYSDSGWVIDEIHRQVEIFAEKKVHCELRLTEFLSDVTGHLGHHAEVEHTEAPVPTGAWQPEPFMTIPNGFKAVIKFKAS